ncbi:uncharacterized protein F5147DRAFT_370088 [Suillus discolor]|uniref:Uncharacterized protein n=1 Tax=Suillus discolor TaxID=1912936 RepID=A0A9P7EXS8_9AGAM|nr:uncharacterized protein F5147DRAFT_370088 [Suillus discolor]KAG2097234.1 hypothetical protein F5147DRAFT_370088 [Suillus discolor]
MHPTFSAMSPGSVDISEMGGSKAYIHVCLANYMLFCTFQAQGHVFHHLHHDGWRYIRSQYDLNTVERYQRACYEPRRSQTFITVGTRAGRVEQEPSQTVAHRMDATATLEATRSLSILMSQHPRILGVEFVIIQQDARQPSANLRVCVCWPPDPFADVYQTCRKPSMNIQAPRPAFPSVGASVVDVSVQSIRTVPTSPSPLSPYPEPPSSGGTPNVRTLLSTMGCHLSQWVFHIPTCSCFLSDVSRINNLEDPERSSSPSSTKISDITVFDLDSSYIYQHSHDSSCVV